MMIDLYLLCDDYAAVHRSRLMQWLNRLIPPNVYYVETAHAGAIVRAKYALVSLTQFERRMGPATRNPYFWARFAQPTGLVWAFVDPGSACPGAGGPSPGHRHHRAGGPPAGAHAR